MSEKQVSRVEDYMSETIHPIKGEATVLSAIKLLKEHDLNALVVERRDADDEIGLVTITDIAREVLAKNRPPERVYVMEIMTKPIVTVPRTMQIRYAIRLMANLDLSQTVVVGDARNPVGIVERRVMVLASLDD